MKFTFSNLGSSVREPKHQDHALKDRTCARGGSRSVDDNDPQPDA